MEISYNKDGNRNTMIIKNVNVDENHYKLQMVLNNRIEGIIPISIEQINNQNSIQYNISSKTRLSDFYARKQMSGKELYRFVEDIRALSEKINEYLLDINSIAFDVEFIYYDRQTGRYEFCYMPETQGDFQIKLRDLFDKLLEYINHNDQEAVMIAYGIQQLTLGVDFTMQDIVKCAYDSLREVEQKNREREEEEYDRERLATEKDFTKMPLPSAEKKKGILEVLQTLFRKKSKYQTCDEMEEKDYLEEEWGAVLAEEQELYHQKKKVVSVEPDERTMLLTNHVAVKPIILTAMGTEMPMKIKPLRFPYIIGKSRYSCDFCIDSAVVSRVHMRIMEELDDYLIEDLNSTNGTFLNGEKLEGHKPHPIEAGDKVTIANIDFIVE